MEPEGNADTSANQSNQVERSLENGQKHETQEKNSLDYLTYVHFSLH